MQTSECNYRLRSRKHENLITWCLAGQPERMLSLCVRLNVFWCARFHESAMLACVVFIRALLVGLADST